MELHPHVVVVVVQCMYQPSSQILHVIHIHINHLGTWNKFWQVYFILSSLSLFFFIFSNYVIMTSSRICMLSTFFVSFSITRSLIFFNLCKTLGQICYKLLYWKFRNHLFIVAKIICWWSYTCILGNSMSQFIETNVAYVVGPSITTSSTNFSFQNLVFWNLFEFSVAKIT
jgi:hypothetical protein